jgi:IclR family acetate operon transcriptional repressor
MAIVTGDDRGTTGERRNHVQSVSRAASLLRCFTEQPAERSMTELAKQTGLTASTAHRLLRTLVAAGLLAHNDDTERYFPGPALLELAGAVLTSPEFMGATEILEALALRTGETASLGIREGNDLVILLQAESTSWLRLNRPVRSRVPLHGSAMGKALLAYGAVPPRRSVKELGKLRELTPNTMTAPAKLVAELIETRQRGYAVADEEQHLGLRSIAAPILWPDGAARAALGVAGPTSRITLDRVQEIGRVVAAAAGAIQLNPSIADQF